ncbi:MAG: hybrid sensor histidine kinase/response regulator [Victivallales bacterium]|nr:hybrid sensor histidine kinase/response regulator [Victivallales bacterium]
MSVGDLSGFSMTGLFLMEAEEQARALSDGLLKLDKNPDDASDVPAMMRAAHSLKGGARIVRSESIVQFAHSMEDYFVAVSENKVRITSAHVDRLLEGVDLMETLSRCGEDGFSDFVNSNNDKFLALAEIYRNFMSEDQSVSALTSEDDSIDSADVIIKPDPESKQYELEIFPDIAETPSHNKTARNVLGSDKIENTSGGVEDVERKLSISKDGMLKVSTSRMERILGCAGETFIHARKIRSLEDSLQKMRREFADIADLADRMLQHIPDNSGRDFKDTHAKMFKSLSGLSTEMADFSLEMEGFSEKLYDEVLSCKIMPFEDLSRVFSRMVRDVSRKLGKKVNLKIIGEKTGLDRDILEKLEAPLVHLLRNAIDHGLETPEERVAAGKNDTGTIVLSAFHWAGMFNIIMTDDGRGIDLDKLRSIIVERGMVNIEMAEKMPDKEILDFLFLPGFTTKSSVSELSGRGVGLDVVMNMIQEVKGEVSIETKLGEFTAFNMRLPVSLSVVPSLIMSINDELYAFPANKIDHLLTIKASELKTLENHQFIEYNNENIGVVSARQIFGYPNATTENDTIPLLVVSDHYNRYALGVDKFIGEDKIAVRPLDKRLGKVSCINSVSVLDDGSTVLVADIEDIVRSIDNHIKNNSLRNFGKSTTATVEDKLKVLVVDDSITVRELEKHILETHGCDVDTAVNGVDGWNAVRTGHYDLVISDIDMPRMNGFELVSRIKSDGRLSDIPVIIVSYKDREEDRLKGMECGANFYLTKSSFHDNTLIEAVKKLTVKDKIS